MLMKITIRESLAKHLRDANYSKKKKKLLEKLVDKILYYNIDISLIDFYDQEMKYPQVVINLTQKINVYFIILSGIYIQYDLSVLKGAEWILFENDKFVTIKNVDEILKKISDFLNLSITFSK